MIGGANCKADQVLNPLTKRCIKIDGGVFKKLDKSLLSEEDRKKVASNKTTTAAKVPAPKKARADAVVGGPAPLYLVAKVAAKILFDESAAASVEGLAADVLSLKHPSSGLAVRELVATRQGMPLLECFVYYFMRSKPASYDGNKTGIIFTKCQKRILYFRYKSSRKEHALQLSNIGIRDADVKRSALLTTSSHTKHRCQSFLKKCINQDDLYLYTNNYDATTWCDFEDHELLKIQKDYCFTLEYILEYITNRLNSSNMNNPSPSYPVNPFTNKILAKDDLKKIKKQVRLSGTKIPQPTKCFLENEQLWLDERGKPDPYKLVDVFDLGLRFKRINSKDSQHNYQGYWVGKKVPKSQFEKYFDQYIDTLDERIKRWMDALPKEDDASSYDKLPRDYLI
jgi:hypothetical protein